MDYNQLLTACQSIAAESEIDCKTHDHSKYNWKGITFQVDPFGGIACSLCYLTDTQRCFVNIHQPDEVEITSLSQLRQVVQPLIDNEKQVRSQCDYSDIYANYD